MFAVFHQDHHLKDASIMFCFQHCIGIAETGAGVSVPCVRAKGERFYVCYIVVEKLGRNIIILPVEKAYRDACVGENIRFLLGIFKDMDFFLRCPAFAVKQINYRSTYAHLSSAFGSLMSARH